MELMRLCPACGNKNPASELLCQNCMTFIADVTPTANASVDRDRDATDTHENKTLSVQCQGTMTPDATVRMPVTLTLLDEKGSIAFTCGIGDIIGRNGAGREYLSTIPTVSREHCRVTQDSRGWVLIDNGSTNGTWVNGVRITAPTPINNGDIVRLSQGCQLKVKL